MNGYPLIQQQKDHSKAQQVLRDAHVGRAVALSRLGRHNQALGDWDRALELDPGPGRLTLRIHRAYSLARSGNYRRATTEADAIARDPSAKANTLYDLSCIYCLSAAAALHGDHHAEADRHRLADRYAARAVELLAKVQEAGLFKQPNTITMIKNDHDLDPIRHNAGFRELMAKAKSLAPSK